MTVQSPGTRRRCVLPVLAQSRPASPSPHAAAADDADAPPRPGKGFRVRPVGDKFLASEPAIGAWSLLGAPDLLVFQTLRCDPTADAATAYERFGYAPEAAAARAVWLQDKLRVDGWRRTGLPPLSEVQGEPLQAVYFTITRICNFTCQYCYQGESARHTHMSLADVDVILAKIREKNPGCFIIVTGGEPLAHPEFLRIVNRVAEFGFSQCVLTNGSMLTREIARHLAGVPRLRYVQVSLDGITRETHEHTRAHFDRVIAAIRFLNEVGVFPVVAPTLHEGNRHEVRAIAEFARDMGGTAMINPSKALPHSPAPGDVPLRYETLFDVLLEFARDPAPARPIPGDVPIEPIELFAEQAGLADPHMVGICGMAHELFNIDYNGDVFPCHLLRYDALNLGNVVTGSWDDVLAQVRAKRVRVPSWEIDKCSQCDWVLSCSGGCRAGAFSKYGRVDREDSMCSLRYECQDTTVRHEAGEFVLAPK